MESLKELYLLRDLYNDSNSTLAKENYDKCATLVISNCRKEERSQLEKTWENMKESGLE